MSLTYPAAFCFQNAADDATITASGSIPLAPPSLLQDQHVGRKWRVEADTAHLTIDLGSAVTIDTVGLFGLNLTAAATSRVRLSLTDSSAQDGAAGDSGSAVGRISSYYGNLVYLRDGSTPVRYVRIDLAEGGVAYIEGGFLMIGLRNQVGINFTFGASDTPVDPSIKSKSRSGATWIDPRSKYRVWELSFEWLSAAERRGWVEDLDRLVGASQNVMVVRDCSSANLGRDTLIGLVAEGAPVISRDGFIGGDAAYSKSYRIEQRL